MKSTALPVDFAAWLSRPSHIGPRPRKPLKKASSKRAKQLREYSKRRKEFLADHKLCEAWQPIWLWHLHNRLPMPDGFPREWPRSVDIHHIAGRLGKKLLDESDWLPVCRICHNWIHAHPKEARKLGLIA